MSVPSYEITDPEHDKTTYFQHGDNFTQDTVYFASSPDFPAYRWENWLTSNVSNPAIHATGQSLDAAQPDYRKFTFAYTTPFVDTIGRSVPAYDVAMFEILDDTLSNPDNSPKRPVLFTCGTHTGECNHSWNLLGFLNWVLSSDPEAVEYRRRFRTTVVPYVHPHALAAGYARVDPLNRVNGSTGAFKDGNRGWLDSNLNDTAGKLKPKILAHVSTLGTGGRISVGADFHERSRTGAHYYWNAEVYDQPESDASRSLLTRWTRRLPPNRGRCASTWQMT